jgi:predicted RNA-binding Zn ribbon-like protein
VEFTHYDDASVDLAIDLVNHYTTAVREAAHDHVHPLPDLDDFLRSHGLDASDVQQGDEQAVQQLADRLHTVFTVQDPAEAVAAVNAVLADAGALPQISGHDDRDWHLHYYPAGTRPVDRLAVTAAMGLATVLVNGGARRLGQCAAHECADVYVDTSRNNRRRFCSEGCSNRSHVAAHRARKRGDHAGEASAHQAPQ